MKLDFMDDDCDIEGFPIEDKDVKKPSEEFERLRKSLVGSEKWSEGEYATYYAFFCHGWFGRAYEAEYQQYARS